jgi:hypothetical protein
VENRSEVLTTVALPFSEFPRTDEAIQSMQGTLRELSDRFEACLRLGEAPAGKPMPYSVLKHADGRVSIIIPVMVTY